jgi:hypothetical protein
MPTRLEMIDIERERLGAKAQEEGTERWMKRDSKKDSKG